MKRSTGGKILCVLLITAALIGAASPKVLRQRAEQKKELRKDLIVVSRCGRAQIRHGAIPQKLFEKCADTYQKIGLKLFPDHNQSSSSSEGANGYGASSVGSSSSAPAMPTVISNPVTSSSASSMPIMPTIVPTPISSRSTSSMYSMMPPTAVPTIRPVVTIVVPTAISTNRPVMTFSSGSGGQNQPVA